MSSHPVQGDARHQLQRHIFASAAGGPRGAGFQTVASAIADLELHAEIEQALEEASGAATRERLHQALTLPGRPRLCLLSRLEPAGAAADARRDSFWAESILVPSAWLEGGQWDLAQAIDRIEFPGPRELPAGPGLAGRREIRLDSEPLAPLAPGPLTRLERLRRLAPAGRRRLLEAVVRQFRDRSPVYVVRPGELDAAEFEQIILLLPLLLPPGRRTAGGARPLHLRTLGFASGSAFSRSIDVLGVTPDQLEEVRREPGTVVDLGPEARPARRRAGAYGEAYADWLAAVLEDRRWQELERFYAGAAAHSGDPIAGFAEAAPQAPPAVPAVGALGPQRRRWQVREREEEQAAGLRREVAADVRQLKAALEDDFARQRAALEQAGAAHLRRLDEVARRRLRDLESRPALHGRPADRPPRPGGRYAAKQQRAWVNPLLIGLLVVLSALVAADFWLGRDRRAAPGDESPGGAEIAPPGPAATPAADAARFDGSRPDRESALAVVRLALISGRLEPSSIWLAWASASIGDPTACALLQMVLGSAVDSHCGNRTASKLAARIEEIGLGSSMSHEARFFEHLLGLDSRCVRRPLILDCLPAVEKARELVALAERTAGKLEARTASRRQQGKGTDREAKIRAELSELVLNVSPQAVDRLRQVPDFLVSPILGLAGELCDGTVNESRDRFDSAALQRCLAALDDRAEAAP